MKKLITDPDYVTCIYKNDKESYTFKIPRELAAALISGGLTPANEGGN